MSQAAGFARSLFSRLSRVKTYGLDDADSMSGGHGGTGLAKVLNTFDLTLLGVGSTLGVGIYVLAGSVAKDIAGPAVCISFLIAAVASAFAALCYAEFGARVPRAGSAYIYSYVTVGEFIAFIIGWNLILEYLIGAASVARAFSANLDALTNNTMSAAFMEYFPIGGDFLAPYADFFALSITLVLAVLLGFGIRSSAIFTNIFTFVNVFVVLFVVITGAINATGDNWALTPENITQYAPCKDGSQDCGTGGFVPFGFAGIMAGAAKCFFAFVGFDSIAATGEEAKDAKRSIPFSIILTLIIVFCAYFSVSVVITLMVPYYEQDPNTPLVSAFKVIGWDWAGWVISIGSLFGLSASLLGAMIPLPRVIYAQAKDGLLFRPLAYIYPKFQTPLISTVISGIVAAILTAIFDLDSLVDMMSIGTLLAYTLVAVSVLILRYETTDANTTETVRPDSGGKPKWPWNRTPTKGTSKNAIYATATYCALVVALCGFILGLSSSSSEYWLLGIGIVVGGMLMVIGYLILQPRSRIVLYFKVPGVPLLPCVSIFINTYLMFQLESKTWIQFGVWMAVGFLVYFGYGMWNSSEEYVQRGKPVPGSVQFNGHTNKAFQDAENPPATKKVEPPSPTESENSTLATAALDDVLDLHDDDQQLDEWIQNSHNKAEQVFEAAKEANQRKLEQETTDMVIVSTMMDRTHTKASKAFEKMREDQEKESKESQERMSAMMANFEQLNDSLSKILDEDEPSTSSDAADGGKNPLFNELLSKVQVKENPEDVSGSRDADEPPKPDASPKIKVPSNPSSQKMLSELRTAFQKAAQPEEDPE